MSMDRSAPKSAGEAPVVGAGPGPIDGEAVERLAALFKALGHPGRLAILCHLAAGEKTVTALEELLGQRQAAVSQQLARLRLEGLVTTRREGKAIHYALACPKVRLLLRTLPELRLASLT